MSDTLIDLRSDTVTRPTAAMRRAMFEAEVGDDVYGEDPTVNRLEARAAEIMGKEAALFLPTGTMGNQAAIMTHTSPGQEVVCEDRSHTVLYELGGTARLSGCLTRTIPTDDGIVSWEEIERRYRPAGDHYRGTALVVIENTHNMAGGRVYPTELVERICGNAHERGVKVHMDGARIFNAAAYLQRPVAELAAPVDSIMFCLSKGLGAPVGSMLAGGGEFIRRARLARKALGGGMRQAGVVAAAGLVALEESPADLETDHANARLLAEALAKVPGVAINLAHVETNILVFDVSGAGMKGPEFCSWLKERGILTGSINDRQVRMVTHHDVSREDCERCAGVLAEFAASPVRA